MEFLVFGLFDPHDLHWLGQQIELSRKGIYTIGFFSFWAVSIGAGSMTVLLMREPSSDIPPD